MTKYEELENKLEQVQKELDRLKGLEGSKQFIPVSLEGYYISRIDDTRRAVIDNFICGIDGENKFQIKSNNCFRTREDCENSLIHKQNRALVIMWYRAENQSWIDWGGDQERWNVMWNDDRKEWGSFNSHVINFSSPYYKTKIEADKVRDILNKECKLT